MWQCDGATNIETFHLKKESMKNIKSFVLYTDGIDEDSLSCTPMEHIKILCPVEQKNIFKFHRSFRRCKSNRFTHAISSGFFSIFQNMAIRRQDFNCFRFYVIHINGRMCTILPMCLFLADWSVRR